VKDEIRQHIFTGHTDWLMAVKVAGKRIISASSDKIVRVWTIEQKSQLHSFVNHSDIVTCLAALGDDLFVTRSFDYSMIVWDTSNLTLNSVLSCEAVDFEKIGFDETCIVYPIGNSVKTWNTNYVEAEFQGHSRDAFCVAKYSEIIVSGGCDNSMRV
jgi:F-box and WD-40 domain protein 7